MKGSQRECHDKGCHDCATEKIVIKDDPVKAGKALYHTLWNCDERAELKVNNTGRTKIGDTRWYRVNYYWPVNRGNGCIIAQFPTYPTQRIFRNACGGNGTHIKLYGDGSVSFEFQRPTKEEDVACTKYTLGEMTTGIWHTLVVHVKWTQESDGFLEVWWDGMKKVDIKNQATFWKDEDRGPYFKVGAYKGDPWKGAEPFEIYTDDVYVFGENATYQDVQPSTNVTVSIERNITYQTILANGINFEGYHTTGGNEILSRKFEDMMHELPCQLNRLNMPLKEWEPENDNTDADKIDFTRFKESPGVKNTFLRMKELEKRGINSWLAIWDIAGWNVLNPGNQSQRQIKDMDELAESITAFLLHAEEKYNTVPAFVSVNEPSIAEENGWGGYQLALGPEEQIQLIRKSGELFEKNHLNTKWLIGLHKVYPSEIRQASQIWEDEKARKYIAGFDFHGYGMQTESADAYLHDWYGFAKNTNLITFCGEADYDNQFWKNDERYDWEKSSREYGKLIYKLLNVARVNGIMPWYGNTPFVQFPYRYVSKHYMSAFPAGTTILSGRAASPSVLVTAGILKEKYRIVIHNISDMPVQITLENIPRKKYKWVFSGKDSYYMEKEEVNSGRNGLQISLPANSLHTLIQK